MSRLFRDLTRMKRISAIPQVWSPLGFGPPFFLRSELLLSRWTVIYVINCIQSMQKHIDYSCFPPEARLKSTENVNTHYKSDYSV